MRMTRRQAIGLSLATAAGVAQRIVVAQSAGPRVPDTGSLESGDFLWPKKPGAFIPYRLDAGADVDADRDHWLIEKEQFLSRARSVTGNPELSAAATRIAPLTYNDFRSLYLRNQDPSAITPYSLGGVVAVGHVAIIQVDQMGERWVIEALLKPGVRRSRYSAWLSGRPGEIVWHGRLKDTAPSDRAKIAKEAVRWIGTPYDFWNFDLANTSGFYCSKLVWRCVMDALHFPLDADPNPKRAFWVSPKQLLYAQKIDRLVDPGEYGSE